MRSTLNHADPRALRLSLEQAIRKFERDARARGVPNEHVVAGRYILCTYIDECASSTPWGGSGAWAAQSLLVEFHNEAWGGEKVFQLLGRLVGNVGANRGLLELIYCVISLGFEGKYRVARNGRAELEGVREKLALKLREQSGSADRELSPRWQGLPAEGRRLRDGLPVWVVATGAAVSACAHVRRPAVRDVGPDQCDLQRAPTARCEGGAKQANGAARAAFTAARAGARGTHAPPRLSTLLKPEIEAGLVEVRDLADRSIVTIKGDGFFEAGSAEVEPRVPAAAQPHR